MTTRRLGQRRSRDVELSCYHRAPLFLRLVKRPFGLDLNFDTNVGLGYLAGNDLNDLAAHVSFPVRPLMGCSEGSGINVDGIACDHACTD